MRFIALPLSIIFLLACAPKKVQRPVHEPVVALADLERIDVDSEYTLSDIESEFREIEFQNWLRRKFEENELQIELKDLLLAKCLNLKCEFLAVLFPISAFGPFLEKAVSNAQNEEEKNLFSKLLSDFQNARTSQFVNLEATVDKFVSNDYKFVDKVHKQQMQSLFTNSREKAENLIIERVNLEKIEKIEFLVPYQDTLLTKILQNEEFKTSKKSHREFHTFNQLEELAKKYANVSWPFSWQSSCSEQELYLLDRIFFETISVGLARKLTLGLNLNQIQSCLNDYTSKQYHFMAVVLAEKMNNFSNELGSVDYTTVVEQYYTFSREIDQKIRELVDKLGALLRFVDVMIAEEYNLSSAKKQIQTFVWQVDHLFEIPQSVYILRNFSDLRFKRILKLRFGINALDIRPYRVWADYLDGFLDPIFGYNGRTKSAGQMQVTFGMAYALRLNIWNFEKKEYLALVDTLVSKLYQRELFELETTVLENYDFPRLSANESSQIHPSFKRLMETCEPKRQKLKVRNFVLDFEESFVFSDWGEFVLSLGKGYADPIQHENLLDWIELSRISYQMHSSQANTFIEAANHYLDEKKISHLHSGKKVQEDINQRFAKSLEKLNGGIKYYSECIFRLLRLEFETQNRLLNYENELVYQIHSKKSVLPDSFEGVPPDKIINDKYYTTNPLQIFNRWKIELEDWNSDHVEFKTHSLGDSGVNVCREVKTYDFFGDVIMKTVCDSGGEGDFELAMRQAKKDRPNLFGKYSINLTLNPDSSKTTWLRLLRKRLKWFPGNIHIARWRAHFQTLKSLSEFSEAVGYKLQNPDGYCDLDIDVCKKLKSSSWLLNDWIQYLETIKISLEEKKNYERLGRDKKFNFGYLGLGEMMVIDEDDQPLSIFDYPLIIYSQDKLGMFFEDVKSKTEHAFVKQMKDVIQKEHVVYTPSDLMNFADNSLKRRGLSIHRRELIRPYFESLKGHFDRSESLRDNAITQMKEFTDLGLRLQISVDKESKALLSPNIVDREDNRVSERKEQFYRFFDSSIESLAN